MLQTSSFTIFDAYSAYLQQVSSKNTDKMLNTIFIRFLIPAWGGDSPKSKRATQQDLDYALEFIKLKPISQLESSEETIEECFSNQKISLANRRVYRSIFKSFLEWLRKQDIPQFETQKEIIEESEQKKRLKSFRRKIGNPRRDWSKGWRGSYGIKHKKRYTLLSHQADYLNDTLTTELEQYKKFREDQGCSKATIGIDLRYIKNFLGWLHRFQGVSLEELSLAKIIQPCILLDRDYKSTQKSWDNYITDQYRFKQNANAVANQNLLIIQDYFDFLASHPKTIALVLCVFIPVAKFTFREYIGTEEYQTDDDIPIVKKLKAYHRTVTKKAKTTPDVIPHSAKSVPWTEILRVFEILRIEADTIYNAYGQERNPGGIAKSLENFLSVAFMVVIPPLRASVYFELEIDKTLVRGLRKNGHFIPANKLAQDDEALWYIHLILYKTGKYYGEYWKDIPNIKFQDDRMFYEYIDRWLNKYRNLKKQCDHNFFFRGSITYERLIDTSFRRSITSTFDRLTGVRVTPKEFRKIFVTYLKDSGASEAELEAAATAMQHSRRMQSDIYDQQTQLNKMAPMSQFIENMFQEHWKEKRDDLPALQATQNLTDSTASQKKVTRLKLTPVQAKEEVKRLQKMKMSQEQIINFLWDATPKTRKKYQNAIAEFEELVKM